MGHIDPWVLDCLELRRSFGWHVGETPSLPQDRELLEFWVRLVEEETSEVRAAANASDLVAIVDGVVDVCVCAIQLALVCGTDPSPAWREVHRSNLAKEQPVPGRKAVKPLGWVPPDVRGSLRAPPSSKRSEVMVSDHEHEAPLCQLAEATERAATAEHERDELRGRVGRIEAEMESLKQRGRSALRCLGAIDQNASPDVIMYGVRDAKRAMNATEAPAQDTLSTV